MFSKVKPAGWAFGERLTSAQMNTLDTDHANAVDGVGGGTYTPSSAITINGAGLACNTFAASGSCTFGDASSDAHTFNGSVFFNDSVSFSGSVGFVSSVTGPTFISSTSLTCNGTADFNGSAVFDSTAFFNDDVTFNDPVAFTDTVQILSTLSVTGAATLSGTTAFTNTTTHMAPLAFGNGGGIRHRVTYGTDASITLTARQCTIFKMRDGVMTTQRTVTLPTSGNVEGDTYMFLNLDDGIQLFVNNGGGNFILQNANDFSPGVMAVYDATSGRFDFFALGIAVVT